MPENEQYLLTATNISKFYPGVKALKNVDLSLKRGTVHALMGENGAGKSTLMKILAGIIRPEEGVITLHGKEVKFFRPKDSQNHGIAMIHQELSSLLEMTIAENIYLGREFHLSKNIPIIDYKKMNNETKNLLNRVGLNINPTTVMKNLSVAQLQLVEIAKAISQNAEIIIMDEPTSAITTKEVERLFDIITQLKKEGRCIIYITHKMEEVFKISDYITIFRDGEKVGTFLSTELDNDTLIRHMVNRSLDEIFPKREYKPSEVMLKLEKISRKNAFKDISFEVRKGEILGLAGLMGAGRTEVVESLFGIIPIDGGDIYIKGEKVKITSPKKAIKNKISLVTEDRKLSGLVLSMNIRDNITLVSTANLCHFKFVLNKNLVSQKCNEFSSLLKIKARDQYVQASSLSGGNQQKVVLGKWLMSNPEILIFDEPTRGIDIGAKTEFYNIISDLAKKGSAVIFISSEMPEILGMCDRVIVMHEGKQSGELKREEATQELLLKLATGTE